MRSSPDYTIALHLRDADAAGNGRGDRVEFVPATSNRKQSRGGDDDMRMTLKWPLAGLVLAMPVAAVAAKATPEALVDALSAVFGKHAGARASHAKGICVKGSFTPGPDASSLSKAPHFAKSVPVLGRFSMGGGNPKVSDKAKTVRAIALRFDPDGKSSDLLLISAPVFFARTPEQMLGFLAARVPGADGKPDAAKVKAFGEANPETGKQAAYLNARPVPASYATVNYWAVHAYTLTGGGGATTTVKLKAVPAAGEAGLGEDEAKAKPDDFLKGELEGRLAGGPASFDLVAIIGEAGDPVADPTAEWPEAERKSVKLGAIAISAIEPDATCDATTFDPANLQDGIAGPKDDSIFAARSGAYAVSLSRRAK
jgi:catalase